MARNDYEKVPYDLRIPAWNEPTPYTSKTSRDTYVNKKKLDKKQTVYHGTFYASESSSLTRFVTFIILAGVLVIIILV